MIRSASALSASARRCCSLQLNLRSAAVAATLWQAQLHRLRPEQQIALGYRSQRFFASLREISDRSGHRNSDGQLKQRKKPVTQRQRRVRDTQRLKKIAAGKLGSSITVANLSRLLEVKQHDLIMELKDLGFTDATHNYVLSADEAQLIATELGVIVETEAPDLTDLTKQPIPEDISSWKPRPPVVTIMGHVDHGKTTLLDRLRKSTLAQNEIGGITQHIGAFTVNLQSGWGKIVFLDTPGHAAFEAMRKRGAVVTDIVVLVVAADDGVKPQTREALKHIREANQPFIVAITKCDKPGTDIERIKQSLANERIEIEDYGGDVQCIAVSSLNGEGFEELETAIVTLAEILDFKSTDDGPCEGWLVESTVVNGLGITTTILVKRGTLMIGSILVAGTSICKVRTMRNETGAIVRAATPGTVVECVGWTSQPHVGDEVLQAQSYEHAKLVVRNRQASRDLQRIGREIEKQNAQRDVASASAKNSRGTAASTGITTIGNAGDGAQDNVNHLDRSEKMPTTTVLNIICRADTQGSAEALESSLSGIGLEQYHVKVVYGAAGVPTESDIRLCETTGGTLVVFNVDIPRKIAALAKDLHVRIIKERIIYRIIEQVKDELGKIIPPLVSIKTTGEAQIAQVFSITMKKRKQKNIAGCRVIYGAIKVADRVQVKRGEQTVHSGSINCIRHHKKEVTGMNKGSECGIELEAFEDFKDGDSIVAFQEILTPRLVK